MKLILCTKCQDVFKLALELRSCKCGHASGRYLADGLNAVVTDTPDTFVLGFANGTLVNAIKLQRGMGDREDGYGHRFEAFIIPICAPTVERVAVKG